MNNKLSSLDKFIYAGVEIIAWGTFVYSLISYTSNLVFMHMTHSSFLMQAKAGQELHSPEIYADSADSAQRVLNMIIERGDARHLAISFCLAMAWTIYRKYRNNYKSEDDKPEEKKKLFG